MFREAHPAPHSAKHTRSPHGQELEVQRDAARKALREEQRRIDLEASPRARNRARRAQRPTA